ncbi:DUF4232 domain-containing protein [Streptomyces sp. NPDC003327]
MPLTRRAAPSLATALVSGALLLTGCGTERTGAGGSPSPSVPPACANPAAGTEREGEQGVVLTGWALRAGRCEATYTVTGTGTEAQTYTLTFQFLSATGEALATAAETVPAVAPGATVRGSVPLDGPAVPAVPAVPGGPDAAGAPATAGGLVPLGEPPSTTGRVADVRLLKVRRVPTDEAPSTGGACPPSGVRVWADEGDAATGLRVVGLHLENCGTRPYRLHGYPEVSLRDEEHRPVDGVRVVRDGSAVATGTGADGPARAVTLEPGERAYAGLVWRDTVEAGVGDPVHAPYVTVRVKPGAAPVTVTPELDLGTTGRLATGPWKPEAP